MARKFTLYWTNFERFEQCPQRFLWYKGWGDINVGGGPGRPKPKPELRSEHHALLGTVTHAAIEELYNGELWKNPKSLVAALKNLVQKNFELEMARRYIVSHEAPTRREMLEMCEEWVLGYLKTLKYQKFLGTYARAERDLVAYVNKYTPIGARVDTIIRRKDTGITMLDHKTSKRYFDRKGNPIFYTNPEQLRWYALCFYLGHSRERMPDRLGFVYLRYPYGHVFQDREGNEEPEPYEGVSWITCTKEDLEGLAERAVEARKLMDREKFPPNPSPQGCKFCDYITVCPARQAQIEHNRSRRRPKEVEHGTASGIEEIGLE